jgi:hypothetical protein
VDTFRSFGPLAKEWFTEATGAVVGTLMSIAVIGWAIWVLRGYDSSCLRSAFASSYDPVGGCGSGP